MALTTDHPVTNDRTLSYETSLRSDVALCSDYMFIETHAKFVDGYQDASHEIIRPETLGLGDALIGTQPKRPQR